MKDDPSRIAALARMQGLVHLSKLLGSEPLKQAQDTNTEGKLSDLSLRWHRLDFDCMFACAPGCFQSHW